ncbi:MAG: GGDEF domain-containing protein [Alphaproteobacteria bacterium]|nr:GGDEF domain-containing protein [Alphaproteobacteria bacterium]
MQYSHTIEKAQKYAERALQRIKSETLTPTPENYELWYVYYSEMNAEITRAIDLLVSENQQITDERCQELHYRFLSDRRENERVRMAGDKIQETIKSVGGLVATAKTSATKYSQTLHDVSEVLSQDTDGQNIRDLLDTVMSGTKEMVEQNRLFEEELTKSSQTMQELRRDLELVRKEALTDGLTLLANRKAFDTELRRMVQEAFENDTLCTLVMLDIDYFKSFNDNFGHQVGDQVLRLVAKTLFDGVKGRDVAARYGGEEFAIILPDTDIKGGLKVSDFLRKAVAGKEVINRNSGEKLGRITLSGGVAEYIKGESVESLLERADSALYTAKHNGRNQIVAAPPKPKAR